MYISTSMVVNYMFWIKICIFLLYKVQYAFSVKVQYTLYEKFIPSPATNNNNKILYIKLIIDHV